MQIWICGFERNKLLIRRWRRCKIILSLIYYLLYFLFFTWILLIAFPFKDIFIWNILLWCLILFIWNYLFKNHFLLLQITCHPYKIVLRISFLVILFFWITATRLTSRTKLHFLCFLPVINSNRSRWDKVFVEDLIRFCFELSWAYWIYVWTAIWTILNLAIFFINNILLPSNNGWCDIGTIINIFSQISSFLYGIKKLLAFKTLTPWDPLSHSLLISQSSTKSNLL